jgi:hypothetical protein
MKTMTGFLMAVLLLFTSSQVCLADAVVPGDAYRAPGEYPAPNGPCTAVLVNDDMGGASSLHIWNGTTPKVDRVNNVTGLAWLDDDLLVYTAGPEYGKPGLYLFGCETGRTAQLLPRPSLSYTSPHGTDYFELFAVEIRSAFVIWYYYAPDFNWIDFDEFRVRENLKSFVLNLSGDSPLMRPR